MAHVRVETRSVGLDDRELDLKMLRKRKDFDIFVIGLFRTQHSINLKFVTSDEFFSNFILF